jgi:hypothetical protein
MADRHLQHTGHRGEEVAQVDSVQVVPGIHAQAHRMRGGGRARVASQRVGLLRAAVRARKSFGVQLDAIGAELGSLRHRPRHRVHEQAAAHAERAQLVQHRAQPRRVGGQVPAVVGGGLLAAVRHQRALRGAQRTHQRQQVVKRVALDVELGRRPFAQQRVQLVHVLRADVAFVRARVHGDAVGAGAQRQRGDVAHVGQPDRPRVAQQRDAVHVHRQRGAGMRGVGQRVHRGTGTSSNLFTSVITCRVRNCGVPR